MTEILPAQIIKKAQAIQLLALDVDGVLSDGKIYLDDRGIETKAFHVHDGIACKWLLERTNIEIASISSREAPCVSQRMQALGITHIYQQVSNKLQCLTALSRQLQLHAEQIAFVGDDLPDIAALRYAGLGIAVANALPFVKQHADWITAAAGGQGAVREVCELILSAQQLLTNIHNSYL
jgi:3-deoxy-D-manno-octulosonate 8-phosphate phosphatase (KDO 8-P phosphatase)